MNTRDSESLDSLRKRPHWSFSRINALVNFCSLAWAFRYVYDAEPQHTPVAPVFGGTFHSALAFHSGRLADGREVSVDETVQLFGDLLTENCRHVDPPLRLDENETIDTLITRGRKMLGAYLDSFDPGERIIGVSVPFSVPLIDAAGKALSKPLIGEFDLTVISRGVYTIVDWKTSARRWPKDKAKTDLQPTCYLYAHYRGTGVANAEFRFDVVTKTKEPACETHPTKRSQEDFVRLGELVRVLERAVANECFYPSDTSWECRNCPYVRACRSWHREHARSFVHMKAAA